MKKLLALLTITCFGLAANAQVYVGIKGGGGLAMLTQSGVYSHTISPGINMVAGLSYKHQIFNRVMLEGDILMDMRTQSVLDYPITGTNLELSSTYISVPMTIHWMMPFNKKKLVPYRTDNFKTFWFVEGGPQIGYALSATTYVDSNFDSDVEAGGIDVGVTGGIGINFAFKHNLNRLVVGARSYYGFLNYNTYDNSPKNTNMTVGGYVAYDFKWSKKEQYRYRW